MALTIPVTFSRTESHGSPRRESSKRFPRRNVETPYLYSSFHKRLRNSRHGTMSMFPIRRGAGSSETTSLVRSGTSSDSILRPLRVLLRGTFRGLDFYGKVIAKNGIDFMPLVVPSVLQDSKVLDLLGVAENAYQPQD